MFDRGNHSVGLHPDDRHFTTFKTPWGRYCNKTAPQGYIALGDGYYTRSSHKYLKKQRCIDGTLLWSSTIADSFLQAQEWIDLSGRHGITLNPSIFRFGIETVKFAGFKINSTPVQEIHEGDNRLSDLTVTYDRGLVSSTKLHMHSA